MSSIYKPDKINGFYFMEQRQNLRGGDAICHKGRIKFEVTYEEIVSCENLLEAWSEFVIGKRGRKDVQEFERHLMTNLLSLHESLAKGTYCHGSYHAFTVSDPKTRKIHKAPVADRVLHHALYRKLYPYFDRLFITDSFSCRNKKGTHKALDRYTLFARKVSQNYRKTAWVLKCDIRKFFASIDQEILLTMLSRSIVDVRIIDLLAVILNSFSSGERGIGLPLGNLTSQLFAKVYMNELDHFIKHRLRVKHYIRYADDFVLFSLCKKETELWLGEIGSFLRSRLRLRLHPDKIFIKTVVSGVDFLGWVHFSHHRVIRTVTKRRMFAARRKKGEENETILASYKGMLSNGNGFGITQKLADRKEEKSLLNFL